MKGINIASVIDHTTLKVDTTKEDIKQLCDEAKAANFFAVCVSPYFVRYAATQLEGTPVKVVTVIGFPFGFSATPAKAEEARRALEEGVDEIDVVVNINALKSGDWNYVRNDIQTMIFLAHQRGRIVKVIFETGLLTKEEIEKLCEICAELDVNFVKTSTGYYKKGATVSVIKQLRKLLPQKIKIKASGGIRSAKKALAMINAGADRIGTSSGIKIIEESNSEKLEA